MKRVVLIHGESGSGKSPLAQKLKAGYGFEVLELDKLYVCFIKTMCPDLYFNFLSKAISNHYLYILPQSMWKINDVAHNLVEEWHQHLLNTVIDESARHDALVVEGWLLFPYLKEIKGQLSQRAVVIVVEAMNGANWIDHTVVTEEQIALMSM